MKKLLCMLLAVALVVVCSCSHPKPEKNEKPLIGISMCSLLIERWYKDREALAAEFSRLGATAIIQNANNDSALQAEQIDDLISRGVDALIVIPVNYGALTEQLSRAKHQGISIIAYERLVEDVDIDAYYSFDNVRVGELLALGLLAGMDEGSIMIINGDENDFNSVLYRQGYMNILQPHLDSGRIKIVKDVSSPNWEVESAYNAVESALRTGIKIDGIIATNDSLAGAAIQVLLEKGIADSTVVVGQDGDLAAYQRIVEGVQFATVYKPYDELAECAALAAYRLSIGRPFAYTDKIDNGFSDVKYYKVGSQLVTAENIDEIVIGGGVYSEEEVYMNVMM